MRFAPNVFETRVDCPLIWDRDPSLDKTSTRGALEAMGSSNRYQAFEPLVGRDACINGATQARFDRLTLHGDASPGDAPFALSEAALFLLFRRSALACATRVFPWRSPKKRWPFQLVPVIAFAI
jgi:hypothetical protein